MTKKQKKELLELCYWDVNTNKYERAYGTDLDFGVTNHVTDKSFLELTLFKKGEGQSFVVSFKTEHFSWIRKQL